MGEVNTYTIDDHWVLMVDICSKRGCPTYNGQCCIHREPTPLENAFVSLFFPLRPAENPSAYPVFCCSPSQRSWLGLNDLLDQQTPSLIIILSKPTYFTSRGLLSLS